MIPVPGTEIVPVELSMLAAYGAVPEHVIPEGELIAPLGQEHPAVLSADHRPRGWGCRYKAGAPVVCLSTFKGAFYFLLDA
jgi:hypothetical protein